MKISIYAAMILLLLSSHATATRRPLGDSRVISVVPSAAYPGPLGYPEGIAVHGHLAYVTTSATFGTTGSVPSHIYVYDLRSGALVYEYAMKGQRLDAEHALTGLAFDAAGHLYVLDTQRGVVRVSLADDTEEVYAGIPDLLPCGTAPAGAPCSPTQIDRPPLPNDIAFDAAGNAYVSDSQQATLWRIPPGGGSAEVWFQDVGFDGLFGPNGLRIGPDQRTLFLVQSTTGFALGTPGYIYTLPLVDQPRRAELRVFHHYDFEVPDGIAFGRSGNLYVALAGSNEISVLDGDGDEVARYPGPARSPGGDVPWDAPASIAFDDSARSLVVTNHALFSGAPAHFVVFDVFVDDRAEPLHRPVLSPLRGPGARQNARPPRD